MAFQPGASNRGDTAIRGAQNGVPAGVVDHRMARHALLAEYRAGRVPRHDVCDAHPELRRAAEHISRATREICPVCEDQFLVLVTYAFGPHLPRSGFAIADRHDMDKVRRTTTECACYVIEVCNGCAWNHLVKTFPVQGTRSS